MAHLSNLFRLINYYTKGMDVLLFIFIKYSELLVLLYIQYFYISLLLKFICLHILYFISVSYVNMYLTS